MNRRTICATLIAAVLLSCNDAGTGSGGSGGMVNPNIKLIKSALGFGGGNFRMGVWFGMNVFCIFPGRLLELDSALGVTKDSLVLSPGGLFVSRNGTGSKLLIVNSLYSDISSGSLLEFSVSTLQARTVRESTYSVSSAVYVPDENGCIYYSYGNSARQIPAGYYKLDLSTLQDSLLIEYISEIGPAEVTNGFDISPDGTKLLFPINRAAEPPLLVGYIFATGIRETLNVSFERQLLWVRYHPTGNQILYSNYPRGTGGSTAATDSEIGVIQLPSLTKCVLDTNPFADQGWSSVSMFPNWSPDGRHIVYGSTKGPAIEPPGVIGRYSLYVLRWVN